MSAWSGVVSTKALGRSLGRVLAEEFRLKDAPGRVTFSVTARDPDGQLLALVREIKARANVGHSFTVVVDPGDEHPAKFDMDGDGAFHVIAIEEGEK